MLPPPPLFSINLNPQQEHCRPITRCINFLRNTRKTPYAFQGLYIIITMHIITDANLDFAVLADYAVLRVEGGVEEEVWFLAVDEVVGWMV
ncbi:hypothetical protein TCE0_033r08417 [Talaromyces pinophilus]|uniref:Uncharacterized protein n=1 Tax=Talaromyces pinophilus TaxID=128442 RepID=A0A6V8HID9_TALPI|nr:hypothetical protein TCE0_033r08417 [Talaromyces pinophilus]